MPKQEVALWGVLPEHREAQIQGTWGADPALAAQVESWDGKAEVGMQLEGQGAAEEGVASQLAGPRSRKEEDDEPSEVLQEEDQRATAAWLPQLLLILLLLLLE